MDEILRELIKKLPESPTELNKSTVKKYIDIFLCRQITKLYGRIL